MSGKPRELNLCGLVAVRSRFEREPASIKRLYFDEATGRKVGAICKALAAARKVYRCVPPAELEKIAGSIHHGGIVAVIDAPTLRAPDAVMIGRWAANRTPLVLLDRIGNAHNLGAIARTAAFFGVENIIIPAHPQAALPGEAAFRVSEGGLEQVTVWLVSDLAALAKQLTKAGYDVAGAAARGGRLEAAATGNRPPALVLGNEEHGLSPEMTAACSRLVTIPGSGRVESLNVSVAGAVLMWELFGRRTR
ncbi:MAG TPA: RNA methyltransferase [Rariglobus sp.]|jgi:TrmH RNA methyltransferase|nr:RNA methyltransferase [Rariglobus sp.]